MSMSLADVTLLISLLGLGVVFIIKLYRLMSAMDYIKEDKKKNKERYDYKFLVIEFVFALFMFFMNLISNLTILTLFSSWVFKLAVFMLSLVSLFFVGELFLLGGKEMLT